MDEAGTTLIINPLAAMRTTQQRQQVGKALTDASHNTDDLDAWRTIENPVEGVWLTLLETAQEIGEREEARAEAARMN